MKYYLSSYRLGQEQETLKGWISQTSGKFAYIPNALDFSNRDDKRYAEHIKSDMDDLQKLDATVELLDLKEYFHKSDALREKLNSLSGIYISGGNVFILRQIMKLSGLDTLIDELKEKPNFIYVGYSAACCVLSPTMKSFAITDDATDFPFQEITEQIWEGLGILDFVFQPHYQSDHPESASTDKEIQYCIENKILFKAYHDGEVLIIE